MLNTSIVHRNLDSKLKVFGFEIFDLVAVLIFAAIMNFVFGRSSLSFVAVIIIPCILGAILYCGKRGKPDGFLVHLFRFHLTPGTFVPGAISRHETEIRKRIAYE